MKWLIDLLFTSTPQFEVKSFQRQPLQWTDDERMLFDLLPQDDKVKFAQAYFVTKPEYIIAKDGKR